MTRADNAKATVEFRQTELLHTLLDAMNREIADYSLLEPMTALLGQAEQPLIAGLVEDDYLNEEHLLWNQTYYTVTERGRSHLGRSYDFGVPGETAPHMAAVDYAKAWLEEAVAVDTTVRYHHTGREGLVDVAGFGADGTFSVAVEVKTDPPAPRAVCNDYERLAALDGDAHWIVDSKETAHDILTALADAGYIEQKIIQRDMQSYADINDALTARELPGLTAVSGIYRICREVDQ